MEAAQVLLVFSAFLCISQAALVEPEGKWKAGYDNYVRLVFSLR